MFEGEKSLVFWAGLIILALASLFLFMLAWNIVIQWTTYYQYGATMLLSMVPLIVGAVVFILIGGWMMKSGVRRQNETAPTKQ